MKRSAIGIAVAVFVMLAGSVAVAQPDRGRDDSRSGWQQERQDDRGGHGQATRNDHGQAERGDERARQGGRQGRQEAVSGQRQARGSEHEGHARRNPNPGAPSLPVLASRPSAPQSSGNRGRAARLQLTPEQVAAIRAEMQLHSQRLADLGQIRALALRTGNASAVALVDTLIARENARHQTQMTELRPARPQMAQR